jgi:hypothetical protein
MRTNVPEEADVCVSPFGSGGDRDVAAAAYRDVLAAVPKGLTHAAADCDALAATAPGERNA